MPLGRGLYLEYIRRPHTGDLNAYLVFRDGSGDTRVIAGAPESYTGDEGGGLEIDRRLQESRAAYGPAHSSRTRQSVRLPTGEQTPEAAWEALTEAAEDLRRRGLAEDVMADNRRANRITRSLMDAAGIAWGRVVGANKLYHLPGFEGEGLKIEAKTGQPSAKAAHGLLESELGDTDLSQPSRRLSQRPVGRGTSLLAETDPSLRKLGGKTPANVSPGPTVGSVVPVDWREEAGYADIEAQDPSGSIYKQSSRKGAKGTYPTQSDLDHIEHRFRERVKRLRRRGLNTAAEYLDNFLKEKPDAKFLNREEARAFAPIRAAEKGNLRRFERRTFRDLITNPKGLINIKEGETIYFEDYWEYEYDKKDNMLQMLMGQSDFVLSIGRLELRSDAYLLATRRGNSIGIQGIIKHSFDEPFDFNIDSKEQTVITWLQEAQLLERSGRGKPFPVQGKWYQKVSGAVSIRNGRLVNPRMHVTDID